jgi:hypothetical protein
MAWSSVVLCQDQVEKGERGISVITDDTKILTIEPPQVTVPRGYALVVGIARYKNLEDQYQLHYPERDAEAIYSILISPEGGRFKAENVHKLIGPNATYSRLRYELESWLPSVAGPRLCPRKQSLSCPL